MPRLLIDGSALSPNAKGVGRYSHRLIEQLASRLERDWSITVLFTERPAPTFNNEDRLLLRRVPRIPELVRSTIVLPSLAVATRADVVIAPMDGSAMSAGRPRITMVHGIPDLIEIAGTGRPPEGLMAGVRRSLRTRNLRSSSAVVCNSEFTAKETIARERIEPEAVRVAYCGVDERFWTPGGEKASVFWPEIGDRSGFVLTIATGDSHENHRLWPEIWRSVRQAKSDVGLAIAGINPGAPYVAELKAEFSSYGMSEGGDYILVPFLDDAGFDKLKALYRDADFYVDLSGQEGFGMQLAEAMATGTTCICSGEGALREVGDRFAVIVPRLEPRSISDTILGAYAEKLHVRDNREQVAYTRRFNWDGVGELVAAELHRLTGERVEKR